MHLSGVFLFRHLRITAEAATALAVGAAIVVGVVAGGLVGKCCH